MAPWPTVHEEVLRFVEADPAMPGVVMKIKLVVTTMVIKMELFNVSTREREERVQV